MIGVDEGAVQTLPHRGLPPETREEIDPKRHYRMAGNHGDDPAGSRQTTVIAGEERSEDRHQPPGERETEAAPGLLPIKRPLVALDAQERQVGFQPGMVPTERKELHATHQHRHRGDDEGRANVR